MPRGRGRHTAAWIGLALVPLVVSAFSLLQFVGEYHPTGDLALLELRTRDLGHDAVLTGPYSRDGWHHLGPALYYATYVPYRLTFGSSLGMLLTALLVNGAAVAGIAVAARRYGGVVLLVASLAGCALLFDSLGPEFLRSPWNPSVTVLPVGLLVMLAWAMTCGSTWSLPIAAALTTFLVQTHVGYVVIAAPLLLIGAVWLVVTRWSALARPAAVAAAVLAALWLAPIIDEVTNDPGNISAVVDYFTDDTEDRHSLLDGLRVLSAQFSLDAGWLTGERELTPLGEPPALYDPEPPVLAATAVAAAAVLVWRGSAAARRFVLIVTLAVATGVVAVARTPGALYQYRLDWTPMLGMMAGLLGAWAVAVVVPAGWHETIRRPALSGAVTALAVMAIINGDAAARADIPGQRLSAAVGELAPDVLADLPTGSGEVVFERGPEFIAGSVGRGLELSLSRRGISAVAGGEESTDVPSRAQYRIVTDDTTEELGGNPRFELVAYSPGGDGPGDHTVAVYRRLP